MADVDNRGHDHRTEIEQFLRERVKVLEARIKELEDKLLSERLIARGAIRRKDRELRGGWGNG